MGAVQQGVRHALASNDDKRLEIEFLKCFDDPYRFVMFSFPWGEPGGPLEDFDGPDKWQTETLQRIGQAVRDGLPLNSPAIRLAIASGHGIGKTALVSWLILWFISTRPNPQIVVTANTQTQLTTKTWRELAKWLSMAVHEHWFLYSATQLKLKSRPRLWYATAVPWSASNASAFAGTHEAHVLLIFDEASEIERIIWETAEGAMTQPGAMWFCFGNPTDATGRFRECWTRFRKRWITRNIDSRDSMMADKRQLNEWIEDYGLDSDFVKVRVLGQFPSSTAKQFIGTDVVEGARARSKPENKEIYINPRYISSRIPRIMGIDVGSYGSAENVIVKRHGPHMLPLQQGDRFREANPNVIAARVADQINKWDPDIVFIDANGYGHSVYLILVQLGYDMVVPVYWGDRRQTMEPLVYYNPRTEIWARMAAWLSSGSIPYDQALFDELTAPELHYDIQLRQRLESKESMEKRGVMSLDTADALALTFAQPVPVKMMDTMDTSLTEPEVE